ncbi:MAG TPA: beta-galactosidase trimerization domain-containing protein, partial [Acidobacteriota bacterium]|nr:beta-galactosidase trimerization domain-containing protein [Acidobacteriota bacterium]
MKIRVLAILVAIVGSAKAQDVPRAKWIEDGLIDAGGTHEPTIFVIRRGGERLDAREQNERAESEDTLRRLKAQGIEVFHTHLYKGFGMAAEMPEMEQTKRTAEIARRLGLKVDTYIQWNSMMYETFFAEEPRAQNWIQRDARGRPIMLTYGYQQSYRYRPCFANQEYLDYLKKVVRYAVEEVKTDFIHFDNFDLNPEPDSCHDEACTRGFRAYLNHKYTPAQRKERFGFENVDFVNPPEWNEPNPPARMQVIFDPAIQEWIDYRCQVMADALRQMAVYAKSMNPEVVIEINPHGITGGNRAWEAGIDHTRLLKWTQAFWTEESIEPGVGAAGRLLSHIRSYKLARTYRNVLMTYISENPVAMAEALAFNQTIGFAGNAPLLPEMLRYVSFYRENRELFAGSQDVATVAVLRSYPSITYNQRNVQLSTILVEQALIQGHIPFDLIFDEHMESLSRYKVLVLPETECLSDPQLAAVRKFVAAGGGLVATGQAGRYDQWRRLRVVPGLKGLVDAQPAARDYEEEVVPVALGGTASHKEYEKGRVVYIPAVQFDGPLPEFGKYFQVDSRYWKLPKNARDITDGVRWAARGDIPVEISGSAYMVANVVTQPEKRRKIVHLVNYNAKKALTLEPVEVTCRIPEGQGAKGIQIYSPDAPGHQTTGMKSDGSKVSFSVRVRTYSLAVI